MGRIIEEGTRVRCVVEGLKHYEKDKEYTVRTDRFGDFGVISDLGVVTTEGIHYKMRDHFEIVSNPPAPSSGKEALAKQYPHYYRSVKGLDYVDFYDIALLFNITDPALQHAIKKLLALGNRGHKEVEQDLAEVEQSLTRYRMILQEHGQQEDK